MTRAIAPWRLAGIAMPMLVWALHFVAVYSLQGLACAGHASRPAAIAAMLGLTVLAWLAIAWLGLRALRARREAGNDAHGRLRRFATTVTALLAPLAAMAVLFTAMPILLLPPCA